MKGCALEVLLVDADGLKHKHFLGRTGVYVIVQCGEESCRGRTRTGKGRRVWWNEKFVFKYASPEWQRVTRLTVKIMKRKKNKLRKDSLIGETTVHLGGILKEGSEKGCMDLKPASYNVVLADGTYEGEVKIGLKFISNVEMEAREGDEEAPAEAPRPAPLCRALQLGITTWRRIIPWPSYFFFRRSPSATRGAKLLAG